MLSTASYNPSFPFFATNPKIETITWSRLTTAVSPLCSPVLIAAFITIEFYQKTTLPFDMIYKQN
jgi:hypothetical protein